MGRKRDFIAETFEHIRENLVDTEQIPIFRDFIEEAVDAFPSITTLERDLTSLDEYTKRIDEINNITAQKLEVVMADVHSVERFYTAQFEADANNLRSIADILNALNDEICREDFETNFNRAQLSATLDAFEFAPAVLNFYGMSDDMITRVCRNLTAKEVENCLIYLPKDKIPVMLRALTVEALCAINIEEVTPERQFLYYSEVANRLVITGADSVHHAILVDAFISPEYAEYLCESIDEKNTVLTVIEYELLTMATEDLDKVNNFLSPLETLDQIQIKYLVYVAEEPYRSLWIRYTDLYQIVVTDGALGVFSPSRNTITINIEDDRENERGAYFTFFHECGHAVDYNYGIENNEHTYYTTMWRDREGQTLSQNNIQDVETHLTQTARNEIGGYSEEEISNVVNNLVNLNRNYSSLSSSERELQKLLADYYETELKGAENNCVSDIFGGVTDNEIHGTYLHPRNEKTGESYWVNIDGTVRRTTEREFFAGYFGRVFVAEPERSNGLNSIAQYMPESYEAAEELIDEMGEKIGA